MDMSVSMPHIMISCKVAMYLGSYVQQNSKILSCFTDNSMHVNNFNYSYIPIC